MIPVVGVDVNRFSRNGVGRKQILDIFRFDVADRRM